MIKHFTLGILLVSAFVASAQKVTLNPTISPWFYSPATEITVTYDVTGTSLASLTDAYAWVWIPGKNTDAKYNVNPASSDPAKTNNVKFVKSVASGKTLFTLSFIPSALFDGDIGAETQLGILLKGNDWSNGQTTDFVASFWDGTFQMLLLAPSQSPVFGEAGEELVFKAETPVPATYSLYIGGNLINSQSGITQYNYTHTLAAASNYATVELKATDGTNNDESGFQIIFPVTSPDADRPANVIPGINYGTDPTKATLCLWAPQKRSVYVVGENSDWKIKQEYLMKKDGEYFWLELSGLTAGQEYGFQYLVDESLYVADPYADKVLDPDDMFIPAKAYPNLKPFPTAARKADWYFNRVSVLQTGQTPYTWTTTNYEKPEKDKLIIYELLVRDFFGAGERNYQNLIDTLNYIKRLGANAIELMPITEFNGNESWGYNPTFMFAPDKYYGTKNKLKEFIDRCHSEGIAVILDVVMNQQDLPNPYVLMYYDFNTGKPTATNPWFNQEATHPFNVFFDMNHESKYTQSYLDTVNYYWSHEYKFDGYRFDLSKGFTQKNAGGSVDAWGKYDASRIAILKRMADKIWSHSPDAYVILEHFAENEEEKELAEYRKDEGKGMMLWGNYNGAYTQNATAASGGDFSGVYHANRSWTVPHLIGYMESHDEERIMYRNLQSGRSQGTYNIKNLPTALDRMKAASLMLFTVPGPKMIWQFGELGYDQSINRCTDGTINSDCRVAPKPVHWDYQKNEQRHNLYDHIAELLKMRDTYPVFTKGTATIQSGTSIVKQIALKNSPYTANPSDASQMNVHMVANFDVIAKGATVEFVHTGTWYDYYTGEPLSVSAASQSLTLKPGEYRMYTDFPLKDPVTAIEEDPAKEFVVYPNPALGELFIRLDAVKSVTVYTMEGKQATILEKAGSSWNVAGLAKGLYVLKIEAGRGVKYAKIIKR